MAGELGSGTVGDEPLVALEAVIVAAGESNTDGSPSGLEDSSFGAVAGGEDSGTATVVPLTSVE